MKKTGLLAALIPVFILGSCRNEVKNEITEANYLHLDSLIWIDYENRMDSLSVQLKENPEKQDSLMKIYKQIYDESSRRNEELALKFASVPSGLRRVFMLRLDFPKDTIRAVLKRIPQEMAESPYALSLQKHLDNKQIKEGDPYYDFTGTLPDSSQFTLSSLKGKQILLLYGGLGCMGEGGRNYLDSIYKRTSREKFEIVVYWPCSTLKELQEIQKAYPYPFIQFSDFLGDHSLFKIIYGAQATPTCFFIDTDGIVKVKCTGLHPERFGEYLYLNKK